MAVVGTILWGAASAFGLYQGARVVQGVADGSTGLGGFIADVRSGNIGVVERCAALCMQALNKAQNLVLAPQQALARGMISEKKWTKVHKGLDVVIGLLAEGTLPNKGDLVLIQRFIEQLIPGLRKDIDRESPLAEITTDFLTRDQEQALSDLHDCITLWLGEKPRSPGQATLVNPMGLLDPVLEAVHLTASESEPRVVATAAMTAADMITPVVRAARKQTLPSLEVRMTDVITAVCIGPNSFLAKKGITDQQIQLGELDGEMLEQIATAFKKELVAREVPLYAAQNLDREVVLDLQLGVGLQGDGTLDFDALKGREFTVDVQGEPDEEGFIEWIPTQVEGKGSDVLYVELMQSSAKRAQTRILSDKLAVFTSGREALRAIQTEYTQAFQKAPEELYDIQKALEHLKSDTFYNPDQYREIAQAKEIASRWLIDMPEMKFKDGEEDGFRAALQAVVDAVIAEISAPMGYKLSSFGGRFAHHYARVGEVLEGNEGLWQGRLRQASNVGRVAIRGTAREAERAIRSVTETSTYLPLGFIKAFTQPEVIARLAVIIFMVAAGSSAIFGSGVSYLSSLFFASVVMTVIGCKDKIRAEHIERIKGPLLTVGIVGFRAINAVANQCSELKNVAASQCGEISNRLRQMLPIHASV